MVIQMPPEGGTSIPASGSIREAMYKQMAENDRASLELSRKKNADYCGSREDADPFANFRLIEQITGGRITTEDGLLVRLTDKLSRVANLMRSKAEVKDEQIEDTLFDAKNYCNLWLTFRQLRSKNIIK